MVRQRSSAGSAGPRPNLVTYEAATKAGKRFRNTEVLTVRDGKIVEVEVYFGWNLPHEAAIGGFVDKTS